MIPTTTLINQYHSGRSISAIEKEKIRHKNWKGKSQIYLPLKVIRLFTWKIHSIGKLF